MSIWRYDADRFSGNRFTRRDLFWFYPEVMNRHDCPFCKAALEVFRDVRPIDSRMRSEYLRVLNAQRNMRSSGDQQRASQLSGRAANDDVDRGALYEERISFCPICGWWIAFRETLTLADEQSEVKTYGGMGALRVLDLADVSTPVEEVRAYLTGRYEKRFELHPRLFEETVASVFRDLGYHARVTAYSGDDGIDVILDGRDGTTVGIQVRRYRGSINVAQIRELTGALVISGLTKGVFVTTSTFQSGAKRTAMLSADHGWPIELYDATRFYEALQLAQGEAFPGNEQQARFAAGAFRLLARQTVSREAGTPARRKT